MAENTTIPKLIDNVDKYFQYEGSSNPTTQDELQAFMKNEHSVISCLVKKLWQPETAYTQGQIVESPNMPVGFSAVALVDGISYSNEPDWGNGTEDVTDGSMKWHLTKGNVTVNGVSPDESGNISVKDLDVSGDAMGALLWGWLHRYGSNYVPSDTSNAGWCKLGICIIYYTENNKINQQPSTYGQLINIPVGLSEEPRQFWISQPNGNIYHRGANANSVLNNTGFTLLLNYEHVFNASGHLILPNGNQIWVE